MQRGGEPRGAWARRCLSGQVHGAHAWQYIGGDHIRMYAPLPSVPVLRRSLVVRHGYFTRVQDGLQGGQACVALLSQIQSTHVTFSLFNFASNKQKLISSRHLTR
jgi:hypothetical protein